jgi:hypothetical protein
MLYTVNLLGKDMPAFGEFRESSIAPKEKKGK